MNWTEYSKFELDQTSPEAKAVLIKNSTAIKIFHHDGDPMLVVGVLKPSLMATPYIWALMTPIIEMLTIAEMRTLVKEFRSYGETAETVIMEENHRAARFASLFGFKPTLGMVEIAGKDFRIWRTEWRYSAA
ncbi:MAG TPA: hypothetical protein VIM69_10660 [Opitutaceae bacterium]